MINHYGGWIESEFLVLHYTLFFFIIDDLNNLHTYEEFHSPFIRIY